ncbi:MAG: prepilin peptidase [Bacilli bacterium]|nr:prepilin peptidase [Bacilli bacterium]
MFSSCCGWIHHYVNYITDVRFIWSIIGVKYGIYIYIIFVWIIGCIFGSFFNVVGYRLPNELSIISPGSFCPKCEHKLKWYELIPIFSYLIQGGKCRKCKQKISIIYPVVEMTTGVLFAVSYFIFGFSYEFLISIIVVSFMVIVIVSDINYLIIPDEVTLFFSILVLVVKLIIEGIRPAFLALFSGAFLFLLMYLIMRLGNFLLKKESLGGGDVKLMFFVGITIGPLLGAFSIFLSSIIALPLSLIVLIKNKDNVIPFGPFILIATFALILFEVDPISILGLFN